MQTWGKYVILFLGLVLLSTVTLAKEEEKADSENVADEKQVDYAKGSVCQYCEHCVFCTLCDEQCPCETGPGKPACKMCKYCKYCYLCKLCDTVCQPGGIIDKVSATLVNAMDFSEYNKEEVDSDIDSVKHWMDKKRDEL